MKLVVQESEPVLFGTGEVLDAEIIPSAGTGRAILVVDRRKSSHQWVSPSQAAKEGLAVQEATSQELGALRGAGYRLPAASPKN
jgi:hypothetical protein